LKKPVEKFEDIRPRSPTKPVRKEEEEIKPIQEIKKEEPIQDIKKEEPSHEQ